MTKKIYPLAIFLILSVIIQIYLTQQYYSVQYGMGIGESVCNINEVFNCDSVALSKYSNIFKIPNALLGVFLNLVLLIGLVGFLINKDREPEEQKYLDFFYNLSLLSVLASLVLGGISFIVLQKVCIFCATLYVLSIATAVCTKLFYKSAQINPTVFLKEKTFVILLLVIPLGGFIGHKIIKNEYSPKSMELEIQSALNNWQSYSTVTAPQGAEPSFVVNKGASIKMVEFADFLCGHCASAHKSISSFLKVHSDVEFSFYSYPLDAGCNKAMNPEYKGPGFSCTLAKGVYCAGEMVDSAKTLHDHIFENQNEFRKTAAKENNTGLIAKMAEYTGTSEKDLESCITSQETENAILNQTLYGERAKVQGTPTVLFQGKKLPGGASFLMLQRAYNGAKN